jgi:hypothetical protein
VYHPKLNVTSDHEDEHILSFADTCWNCPYVVWPTRR